MSCIHYTPDSNSTATQSSLNCIQIFLTPVSVIMAVSIPISCKTAASKKNVKCESRNPWLQILQTTFNTSLLLPSLEKRAVE
jgi:hypothetical protein